MEGRVAIHGNPAQGVEPVYGGLWAWMWPNLGVNAYGQGLMLERMSPTGHNACRLDYVYLMPKGVQVTTTPHFVSLGLVPRVVTAEDKWIVERVQQNLDAGVYETGRLSPKHEVAVAAFQAWVGEAVG